MGQCLVLRFTQSESAGVKICRTRIANSGHGRLSQQAKRFSYKKNSKMQQPLKNLENGPYAPEGKNLESTRVQSRMHVTGKSVCSVLFLAISNQNINRKAFSHKTTSSNSQKYHMYDPNSLCWFNETKSLSHQIPHHSGSPCLDSGELFMIHTGTHKPNSFWMVCKLVWQYISSDWLEGKETGENARRWIFWHEFTWIKCRKYCSSLFKYTGVNQKILATIRAYLSTKVRISYHGSKKHCLWKWLVHRERVPCSSVKI